MRMVDVAAVGMGRRLTQATPLYIAKELRVPAALLPPPIKINSPNTT
jgi:hypothetical protein